MSNWNTISKLNILQTKIIWSKQKSFEAKKKKNNRIFRKQTLKISLYGNMHKKKLYTNENELAKQRFFLCLIWSATELNLLNTQRNICIWSFTWLSLSFFKKKNQSESIRLKQFPEHWVDYYWNATILTK